MRYARAQGLQVVMKPHVWSSVFWREKKWRGDIKMSSDTGWTTLEENYKRFIIHYADLAEQAQAQTLVIGLEYRIWVRERPEYWRQLSSGCVNSFPDVWSTTPTGTISNRCRFGRMTPLVWGRISPLALRVHLGEQTTPNCRFYGSFAKLKALSDKYNKPVVFTEVVKSCQGGHLGYANPTSCKASDLRVQSEAYRALFSSRQHLLSKRLHLEVLHRPRKL